VARELGIDIAVDLNGSHHTHCRPQDLRVAGGSDSDQLSGLPGHPGGRIHRDYLIADGDGRAARAAAALRGESRLSARELSPVRFALRDRGQNVLTRGARTAVEGFVFCCFNNSYKILPEVFDRWMRIV